MRNFAEKFNTTISVGGRPICNLSFADDINLMEGSENELQDLATRLVEKARAYVMTSQQWTCQQNTPINIMMNGQNIEEVDSFKYLDRHDHA